MKKTTIAEFKAALFVLDNYVCVEKKSAEIDFITYGGNSKQSKTKRPCALILDSRGRNWLRMYFPFSFRKLYKTAKKC